MDIMNLEARVEEVGVIRGVVTVPNKIGDITVNGTYDYKELVNKPKINGVDLVGAIIQLCSCGRTGMGGFLISDRSS